MTNKKKAQVATVSAMVLYVLFKFERNNSIE